MEFRDLVKDDDTVDQGGSLPPHFGGNCCRAQGSWFTRARGYPGQWRRAIPLLREMRWCVLRCLFSLCQVWAGGRGDDLAKSPHMCRIGTSVYPDISPNDPTCQQFGFYQDRTPTPMMAKSVIYKLHSHNKAPGMALTLIPLSVWVAIEMLRAGKAPEIQ